MIELIKVRSPKADKEMDVFQGIVDRYDLYKERRQVIVDHLLDIEKSIFDEVRLTVEVVSIFYSEMKKGN